MRGGGSGCRGVENGVEEELPVDKRTHIQIDMPSPFLLNLHSFYAVVVSHNMLISHYSPTKV